MKIAILGARGYLGSYLCKYFEGSGHIIVPVTRETLDLLDFNAVNQWVSSTQPTVIINCAAVGGGPAVDEFVANEIDANLRIFLNFYNSPHKFRFINVGSGAEFDRTQDINQCSEHDIFHRHPISSYGMGKNTIARICLNRTNFFTVRLFGCFDASEPKIRLFQKILSGRSVVVNDRYFDYVSAYDFATVVRHYCEASAASLHKDLNCVYREKTKLYDIAKLFVKEQHIKASVTLGTEYVTNYTGDGSKLVELNLDLEGLETGIRNYL